MGLDESHGLAVYRLAERWVRRGGVPGERAESVWASGVIGLRVTLRLDGVTLGMGAAVRPDLGALLEAEAAGELAGQAAAPVDLVGLLESATIDAIRQAVQEVKNQRLEARIHAVDDERVAALGGAVDPAMLGEQLNVDVQIAHSPRRMFFTEADPKDILFARFAPGYHGLLADPDGGAAGDTLVWPATVLASNTSPRAQVLRLLKRAGLQHDQQGALGRPGGVPTYRFEVLHTIRPTPDAAPQHPVRGRQQRAERFVDEQGLMDMADRVGLHLFGRFIGQGRVRGTYYPAKGVYSDKLASDREAALASYALMRQADRKRRDGNHDKFFDSFDFQAGHTVERIVGRLLGPNAKPQPVTTAFCLLTILEAPAGQFDPGLRPRVTALLQGMIDAQGRVLLDPQDPESVVATASSAVVLLAMARLYEQTLDPEVGQCVAMLLDDVWTRRGPPQANALPWLAMAHVSASSRLMEAGLLDAEVAAKRAAEMRRLYELITDLQIIERPKLGPSDVRGGIVLQPGPEGSPPAPTWQTAPMLNYIAAVLRDPAILPPAQRADALVTAAGATRFLRQLIIDKEGCYAIRSPEDALGGVRLSLWDNRLDLAPQALTLLALIEMRDTLDRLRSADQPDESE